MYGIDPITGTTDDAFRKNSDGTPKPHNYSKDATKFTSKENLVKAEEFVKNSQKYKDEFVIAERNGLEEIVVENIKLEDIFGTNYKDAVFGKTRIGTKNNPIGTTQTDFTDGTVKAVFKKDSIGQWSLESMFAKPKQ